MRIIKKFKIFESLDNDTLWVFDFDDTLVVSKRIEEYIYSLLNENIKYFLDKILLQIGADVKDLKLDNGRYYVDNPEGIIKVGKDWTIKKDRLYLTTPDEYIYSKLGEPKTLTEISDIYNRVKNKAIVTARSEKKRVEIEEYLKNFGLEYPNYGLYCYPGYKVKKRSSTWKAEQILNIIKTNDIKNVIFYDDDIKNIRAVKSKVKELTDVNLKVIKVNRK